MRHDADPVAKKDRQGQQQIVPNHRRQLEAVSEPFLEPAYTKMDYPGNVHAWAFTISLDSANYFHCQHCSLNKLRDSFFRSFPKRQSVKREDKVTTGSMVKR